MPFNSTLADALRYAISVGTLSASTTPTSTQGDTFHTDAFSEVKAALIAAELDPSSVSGNLDTECQRLEAMITSANVLLAKESLGKEARLSAESLLERAMSGLRDLRAKRSHWLTQGGSAAGVQSGWAASHTWDDRDPDIDQTPGVGDVPYAPLPSFEATDRD